MVLSRRRPHSFSMMLEHSYAGLPGPFTQPAPTPGYASPTLIAWNTDLAGHLGLDGLGEDPDQLARWFSGTEPLPGSRPVAQAYAGHQFGQFVPQLGDGRAALLGEVVDHEGKRWDIQLKGSGRTDFSRGGDGKSSLGPVIREYLLSEAMHALGVPTTRALAAVATGETVFRNRAEAGGVFTRVAASHLRIGTFQYFAARGQNDALRALADYAIARHDPGAAEAEKPYLAFFEAVVERQSRLVAHWLSIGFVHGVMNTDNTAISGETLDYGPCAFLDEYAAGKVFSSIDRHGRYAYGNQPAIVHWNLARLAECLLLLDEDLEGFQAALDRSPDILLEEYLRRFGAKLGLRQPRAEDRALVDAFLSHLEDAGKDFTVSFRDLAERIEADDAAGFGAFETGWRARLAEQGDDPEETRALMNSVNPAVIPRNHQVERAIQAAFDGDYDVFRELHAVLKRPFEQPAGAAAYVLPPREQERVTQTFCGT
jgi:uncharacterized protein YdiU (UPF0061 family)